MHYPNPHPIADESAGTSPNKIKLRDVYLRRTGRRAGQDIWIVDGARVRRDIFDEFLQGGNDQRYRFVPRNEIWIDDQLNCAEMEYQIIHQLRERASMARGADAQMAYGIGSALQIAARRRDAQMVVRKEERLAPVTLGTRDKGTKQSLRQSRSNRNR